ncbi:hypothetical protein HN014_07990 [Aquimarina sp. TRL1]|uniref:hypothetical protein n=1 Tax=Aquimarina sp. (strain TRL1) TaxID=2736252 RepID=UPI001589F561|nr:hypothetical protein [Aquimarina sp. TRL1]QKX04858.1 hypothetical protein HN014_07990 [Aquimarina sp. TRL1]
MTKKKIRRSLSARTILSQQFNCFNFSGIWKDVLGAPETSGIWIVYGREKHGKTTFNLLMSEYISSFGRTLYVSAEEGIRKTFSDALQRAKIDLDNKNLQFVPYISLAELDIKISSRQAPKYIFIDNITVYLDELKSGGLRKFCKKHSNKLIVFIAHEEANEPYSATAKLAKKLADIICRVQGLTCFVSGRCPGGKLIINEEKAALYHGSEILK